MTSVALADLAKYAQVPKTYVAAYLAGRRQRRLFDEVETYCMFIGHARSGHSLVGSLLSAHPDIVIAHELDALRYVRWRFNRDQLYHLILQRDQQFSQKQRRQTKMGYQYAVPDEWQGRFRQLRVVGDKKGGASTRKLRRHPELLDRLRQITGVPVRLINVIRNPYDNISTISRRSGKSLALAAERYFERCETVDSIRHRFPPADIVHVRYESFMADPTGSLAQLCSFLGVDAGDDYLSHCAQIVFTTPHRSRSEAPWTDELIKDVGRQIERFEFLAGYTFSDDDATSPR